MRKDNENIEEKLIPYLEGVLNPKERREVDEAINSDGDLAREMSELREVILELRQGFANGMKPPQEELSVDEVVELGANTGSVDSMPGTSQQKARLFCSDDALEEYSLLRALQEEMARTTLDRENVPEMPEFLLKEFRGLKATPHSRKVLAFDKNRLSPIPLWRRASSLLDRIDPKPLMASAAALMMLSLGVHLYNRPGGSAAPTGDAAEIGYNFASEKKAPVSATPSASSTPRVVAGRDNGVAVFTSDDRGLLKEQAEKLLSKKLNYTVTKDRILVAAKDVKQARDILWADSDGKVVAMGKEDAAEKRIARPGAAAGGASPAPAAEEAYYVGSSGRRSPADAPVVDVDDALAAASSGAGDVKVYSPPSRQDAPPKPSPPRHRETASYQDSAPRSSAAGQTYRPSTKASRDPGAELEQGIGSNSALKVKGQVPTGYGDDGASPPPRPSAVDITPTNETKVPGNAGPSGGVPEPTVVETRSKANETPPPMSAERRQKLRELALRGESEGAVADKADKNTKQERDEESVAPVAAAAPPPLPRPVTPAQQTQTTVTMDRGRVAAAPPLVPASAPVANVITAGAASSADAEEAKEAKADGRLARMETARQAVAQRNGVELSFESKNGKVSVYVRPKKTLTKAEQDALRKTLRKELGLADSDTIILR
jgi:hypothetical protein